MKFWKKDDLSFPSRFYLPNSLPRDTGTIHLSTLTFGQHCSFFPHSLRINYHNCKQEWMKLAARVNNMRLFSDENQEKKNFQDLRALNVYAESSLMVSVKFYNVYRYLLHSVGYLFWGNKPGKVILHVNKKQWRSRLSIVLIDEVTGLNLDIRHQWKLCRCDDAHMRKAKLNDRSNKEYWIRIIK